MDVNIKSEVLSDEEGEEDETERIEERVGMVEVMREEPAEGEVEEQMMVHKVKEEPTDVSKHMNTP